MERLTERNFEFTSDYVKSTLQSWSIAQALKKLQEYENKEEDGLLIELPSKVGDTVYTIHLISPTKHIVCEIENVDRFFLLLAVAEERFGKTVFLTRSEAEEALAKMGGNDHEQNYQGNT